MTKTFDITPEQPDDHPTIETLLDAAFGIGRRTKTSYRLREGEAPVSGLSFVAREAGRGVVGAISFWSLHVGDAGTPALLLGPLAVDPERQGKGIGLALMRKGLAEAARQGHRLVILVGDEPYYARVGFSKVPEGKIALPGPVDPARLLFLELAAGAFSGASGLVLPPHRFAARQKTLSDLRDTTSHLPEAAASPAR